MEGERLTSASIVLYIIAAVAGKYFKESANSIDDNKFPLVLLPILAHNKAHTLPHYLGYIDELNYPKSRIALWVRTDHNVDNTSGILEEWLDNVGTSYHSADFRSVDEPQTIPEEKRTSSWRESRGRHISKIREEALAVARGMKADYIFFVDSDNFVENRNTLQILMDMQKTIVAPLMESQGFYSNFWCSKDLNSYSEASEYLSIRQKQKLGCFQVPIVHSTFLVDLRHGDSKTLTFKDEKVHDYNSSFNDVLAFAKSAQTAQIEMFVCNHKEFGVLTMPVADIQTLEDEVQALANLKLNAMESYSPHEFHYNMTKKRYNKKLTKSMFVSPQTKEKDMLGFDRVFVINLRRRTNRKERMLTYLDIIGVKADIFEAVDGFELNATWLDKAGVKVLEAYKDRFAKRPINLGEIGCAMSHHGVWMEIVNKGYEKVLVFEDDVLFVSNYRQKLKAVMTDAEKVDWDLIYLAGKYVNDPPVDVTLVEGSKLLVRPGYTYWTASYAVTLRGATKLLNGKPLEKLTPVDEYIPIMYDKHPDENWKAKFYPRDLHAFAAVPWLNYPSFYIEGSNHNSDVRTMPVIDLTPDQQNTE